MSPWFYLFFICQLYKIDVLGLNFAFDLQAAAEKMNKQMQHQINDIHNKLDEANRTLNDFDASKKKLAAENTDLLRQVEEAENNLGQLAKIKLSLTNQLEDQRKLADDESRVRKFSLYLKKSGHLQVQIQTKLE